MKNKILLVDSSAESRGFFSTINLLLLTLYWCGQNNLLPVVSSSVLSLYGSKPHKLRAFSEFFGELYQEEENGLQTMEIAHVHNNNLFNFNDPEIIKKLSVLNKVLLDNLTEPVKKFLHTLPLGDYSNTLISVHFRGCDYLKSTPISHTPNSPPQEFLRKIEHLIMGKGVFVATDDISFVDLALSKGHNIAYFSDVCRKGPGRGVHIKSFLGRWGFYNGLEQSRKGYEVMRDVFWLSKNEQYIGSNSNLMYYAKLLNPAQKQIYVSQIK